MEKDDVGPAPVGVQEKPKKGRGSKKAKTEGLNASVEQNQGNNAQAQTKTTSKVPKTKAAPKRGRRGTGFLIGQRNSNQGRSALRSPSGTEERSVLMITAPQEMEERIGELKYREKIDGMGGRTKRFRQTWEQIGKGEFINTGFYLRFKDQNSKQKLEEDKMIIPFRGTQEEKEAYQEILNEVLEEGIVVPIQQSQVKWWNHTFLIKKPNGTWRKILDASKLNKEIEKLLFKMHGLGEVQYQANQMDYATSLDLKSAFHHITVSPNSIPYLAFNFNNNNYAYKAIPFGTKHSPIFFAEAIESILRQIRIHSEIKILNYCDDILLIHQNKQILKTQTMQIMKTFEQFGWTISIDKCEIEPKQVITFLGWIWNLREMNIRMSEERKSKMIQALKDWCN
ncbi:MAG: putative reverse transcriptase, partial [Streblomastix strix]